MEGDITMNNNQVFSKKDTTIYCRGNNHKEIDKGKNGERVGKF